MQEKRIVDNLLICSTKVNFSSEVSRACKTSKGVISKLCIMKTQNVQLKRMNRFLLFLFSERNL